MDNNNDFSGWSVGDTDSSSNTDSVWGSDKPSGDDVWGDSSDDVWGSSSSSSNDVWGAKPSGNDVWAKSSTAPANDVWAKTSSTPVNTQKPANDVWANNTTQNTGWTDTPQVTQPVQAPPVKEPVSFHFGTKMVAVIIAVLLVVGIGVLMFFDGLAKKKQQAVLNPPAPVEQTQPAQPLQPVAEQSSHPVAEQPQVGGTTLIRIPDTTSLNYSGDNFEANGAVAEKKKFMQGNQVVYCVVINISVGASTETVNYYCTYASFNAVSVGDVVVVSYQNVGGKLISVNSISK